MPNDNRRTQVADGQIIDLRQPGLAAFWGWLLPGAGHLYQRRYAKGILFMVCILTTYFFGLAMGGGHVVYASWRPGDQRWQYFCQLPVGLPALPAIVQAHRVKNGLQPLMKGIMAPPHAGPIDGEVDELAKWNKDYSLMFDLGTVYTMIAGLLNVLAIYDAFSGPAAVPTTEETPEQPPLENAGATA